jgi:molybdate transport system permease protein
MMNFDLSPLWISLKTATLATFITFFLGLAVAYWMLGYRGRWKSVIEGILLSPLVLPPTVVGFLLLLLFGKNGPIGQLLLPFDFTIIFTWYAAAIAATVVSFPLMYKTALGAFEQIDSGLLQVARTLGASEWRIFWRVTLPLAFPGVMAGTMLAFARALGEFGATLMLAGNIPGQTQTIPMAIYFAVEAGAMNEAWFWAIVIMAISLSGIVIVNLGVRGQGVGSRAKGVGFRGQGSGFAVSAQSNGVRGQELEVKDSAPHLPISPSPQAPSSPYLPLPSSPHPPIPPSSHPLLSPSSLFVDIQKQLSGFSLDVSFEAQQEALGLLGSSGAGKSMILRCIAGVETPSGGRIVLNGRVLFDADRQINLPSRQRQVGLVFQNYALFPHLTVAQNIAFGLHKLPKTLRSQRVAEQLAAIRLDGLGDRYPHQLSGGQQQRVALARALAPDPEVLLLDEPFSALDTHLRNQLERQLIETLSAYTGVTLFVTHNLEEAYRVCRNLLVMSQGKAIAQGSKQAIFERPNTYTTAVLTGCKNFSRAQIGADQQIEAIDWGCSLKVLEPVSPDLAFVGIRAHQIGFTTNPHIENTFPAWLTSISETQHRMTLFLKLNAPAQHVQDYHLQAEVFKEKWATIKDRPFPWYVQLDPLRLMAMVEDSD